MALKPIEAQRRYQKVADQIAGLIRKGQWVQMPENAGRAVGEHHPTYKRIVAKNPEGVRTAMLGHSDPVRDVPLMNGDSSSGGNPDAPYDHHA